MKHSSQIEVASDDLDFVAPEVSDAPRRNVWKSASYISRLKADMAKRKLRKMGRQAARELEQKELFDRKHDLNGEIAIAALYDDRDHELSPTHPNVGMSKRCLALEAERDGVLAAHKASFAAGRADSIGHDIFILEAQEKIEQTKPHATIEERPLPEVTFTEKEWKGICTALPKAKREYRTKKDKAKFAKHLRTEAQVREMKADERSFHAARCNLNASALFNAKAKGAAAHFNPRPQRSEIIHGVGTLALPMDWLAYVAKFEQKHFDALFDEAVDAFVASHDMSGSKMAVKELDEARARYVELMEREEAMVRAAGKIGVDLPRRQDALPGIVFGYRVISEK